MLEVETHPGMHINTAVTDAIELANSRNESVRFDFNGVEVVVTPGMSSDDALKQFREKMDAACEESRKRREAYLASPEGIAETKRVEEAAAELARERCAAFDAAPAEPTMRDAEKWQNVVAINPDPYGAAVIDYARNWARLMEGAIAGGTTVQACAERMSHLADTDGITGFMYGCAVGYLSECWVHGEELRRWHNLDCQIGNEGEKANESGGVLNPALFDITPADS